MEDLTQYLVNAASLWGPKIVGALLILVVFYILTKVTKRLITSGAQRLKLDDHLTTLLVRASRITLMIFGFISAFGTLGINISALVAGLGLTGFALGFAMKDTISNLLSGVLILLYRPFEIGNQIKIAGYQGTVVAIDLRYTELESEGNRVLIPNSKLFTDPITVLQ